MKKIALIWGLLLALSGVAMAAGGHGVELDHAAVDITNKASLQRGAKYFANYCLSCHSAKYSRFSRVGEDLGLTTIEVENNLIFTDAKVRDPMRVAMRSEDARTWFGAQPPDLSLVARARGADWIYTYLRSFYLDDMRPFGVNNLVLPNASMPHVLWDLQGWQALASEEGASSRHGGHEGQALTLVEPGEMSPEAYDRAVLDLVNFLVYLGEPAQLQRKKVGVWVLAYLIVFFVVAYMLKKEYWRDIH
jgi:ubiquinol-cytochrome c reductase cytochrome c1 subunit